MNTAQVPLSDAMAKAHAVLMKDLKELGQCLRSPDQAAPGQLCGRLTALQKHVAEHFRFEEQNGYMSDVLKRKPNLERDVERLQSDHRQLTETLEQLVTEAQANVVLDETWYRTLEGWLTEIKGHEIRENELIQDAYNLDISAED